MDPVDVVVILSFLFSLYLVVLSCVVFSCFCCRCRRSCRRRTELNRRAATDRTRSNAPAPMHPWRSMELMPPVALPLVEPWGMASAAVRKELPLPYFKYSAAVGGGSRAAAAAAGERLVCAICLEAFVNGATCSEVPACRHLFHRDCIELWTRSNSTCPLCKAAVVPRSRRLSAAEDMV